MQNKKNRVKFESQTLGDTPVEVYWIHAADSAEIAITHIRPHSLEKDSRPIILLHGTYSKRNFWISPKGIGLGPYLAQHGFDVWIPELRGHGLSPKGDHFSSITAEHQIRFDIPAIQAFVHKKNRKPITWVCHSFGGVYALAALAGQWLDPKPIQGLLAFGSQISKGERFLKIPPLAWLCKGLLKLLGHFPAPKLGLGPEIESAGTMIEVIRWKEFRGKWVTTAGGSYWKGMGQVRIPVICFAGAADKNDPPAGCKILYNHIGSDQKTYILLGEKNGFQRDYDHIGMIVSQESQAEIWPLIVKNIETLYEQKGRRLSPALQTFSKNGNQKPDPHHSCCKKTNNPDQGNTV